MNALYVGYTAASVCICLPFIYWATAPDWHRSQTGRALMMLLSSLAALFTILMAGALFRDHVVLREILRYVVFSYVLIAGVRLAILFIQLRLRADWNTDQKEESK